MKHCSILFLAILALVLPGQGQESEPAILFELKWETAPFNLPKGSVPYCVASDQRAVYVSIGDGGILKLSYKGEVLQVLSTQKHIVGALTVSGATLIGSQLSRVTGTENSSEGVLKFVEDVPKRLAIWADKVDPFFAETSAEVTQSLLITRRSGVFHVPKEPSPAVALGQDEYEKPVVLVGRKPHPLPVVGAPETLRFMGEISGNQYYLMRLRPLKKHLRGKKTFLVLSVSRDRQAVRVHGDELYGYCTSVQQPYAIIGDHRLCQVRSTNDGLEFVEIGE